MGGMVGRMFREFAVTIAVAILISGFVSLTLTPMLCARVLKVHHGDEKQNIVLRMFEAMFRSWLRGYEWSLDKVLKAKSLMLAVTIATLVGTVYALCRYPQRLFPDRGYRIYLRHHGGGHRHLHRRDVGPAAKLEDICASRTRRSSTSIPPSAPAALPNRPTPDEC